MFKLTFLGVFILVMFLVSGYFAFFHNRPQRLKATLLEDKSQPFASQVNQFIVENPQDKLAGIIDDLNWIIANDYQRDYRVRRVVHQDLKSLAEIAQLKKKLAFPDPLVEQAYDKSVDTINDRVCDIRYSKDQGIREEIFLLSEMIEENDR